MMETEFPGTVLLSEANMPSKDAVQYFGRGDEFQMSFNFPVMPRLFDSFFFALVLIISWLYTDSLSLYISVLLSLYNTVYLDIFLSLLLLIICIHLSHLFLLYRINHYYYIPFLFSFLFLVSCV